MVYSASSASSLLNGSGDPAFFLKRYLVYGALGLVAMHLVARRGLPYVKRATPAILLAGFGLTVAAMLPGIGVTVNGATRWVGAGPVQFQPSELLKIALVLYGAQLLARRPKRVRTLGGLTKPLLIVVGAGVRAAAQAARHGHGARHLLRDVLPDAGRRSARQAPAGSCSACWPGWRSSWRS